MNVDETIEYLEHQGLSDDEIDEFLEHFGVKGMKWGVRRERRAAKLNSRVGTGERFGNRNNDAAQRKADRMKRVATGKAKTLDLIRAAAFEIPVQNLTLEGFSIKDAAARSLKADQKVQKRIIEGRNKWSDRALRLNGIDVRELDLSY